MTLLLLSPATKRDVIDLLTLRGRKDGNTWVYDCAFKLLNSPAETVLVLAFLLCEIMHFPFCLGYFQLCSPNVSPDTNFVSFQQCWDWIRNKTKRCCLREFIGKLKLSKACEETSKGRSDRKWWACLQWMPWAKVLMPAACFTSNDTFLWEA